MKHLLIVTLSVLWLNVIWAQRISVIDKTTQQPIQGVNATGTSGKDVVVSDINGKLNLSPLQHNDSIILSHVGYGTMILTTNTIQEDQTIEMYETTYSIDDMVISASRFEESRDDVAQSVQIITSRELAHANPQTSADALQNSGNVFVQRSQFGGGSPVLRGFETNKVLLVVDGIRMNNAIYRGGHLQNVITLDNNSMDRIEVVFGPGSVVYGSDALGGVMHFHTKKPLLSTDSNIVERANAFVRYASANEERTGHIDFNIGGNKLASFTSVNFSDFNDLRQGAVRNPFYPDFGKREFYVERINGMDSVIPNDEPNLQVGTGYRQIDLMEKLLYRPNERISHMLNLQYSTTSDVPRYDRLNQTRNGLPRFGQWYYGPQKRLLTAYHLNLKGSSAIYDEISFIAAYQHIEESRHNRNLGSDILNHRTEQVEVLTANLDLEKELGRHELRYGLEGTYNEVTSTAFAEDIVSGEESDLDTRYPDGGSTMHSAAAFITHAFEISPKWVLNDGIRASYVGLHADFTDTSFFNFPFTSVNQQNTAVNGSLGLVYKPGAGWRLAVLGSSGFRAPNVDDLSKVFESIPGQVVLPNPDLKPEYTYNAEMSITKTFDDAITVGGTGYYTWYVDAITTQKATFNGQDSIVYDGQLSQVTMNTNAGEAYIYGVNGFINADITHNFSMYSTLNYTYGRIKTDSTDYPLDHIPPVFGKTGCVLSIRKFRGEFFTMYHGWKRLADYNLVGEDNISQATSQGMPAWYTLNLRTAYQINRFVRLQFAVENILDYNYRVFASGVSAPGRNFILTLRATL